MFRQKGRPAEDKTLNSTDHSVVIESAFAWCEQGLTFCSFVLFSEHLFIVEYRLFAYLFVGNEHSTHTHLIKLLYIDISRRDILCL